MALVFKEKLDTECCWGIWKIDESEHELLSLLDPPQTDITHFESIPHPRIRKESVASRLILKTLVNECGEEYQGLFKNKNGKPFLYKSNLMVSYSHTEDYAAAIVHRTKQVGIDTEHIQEKMYKIAPRFMSDAELESAKNDLEQICVYWCAKEAMYKLYNVKTVEFRDNLKINPFLKSSKGVITGEIHLGTFHSRSSIHYHRHEDVMVALCF